MSEILIPNRKFLPERWWRGRVAVNERYGCTRIVHRNRSIRFKQQVLWDHMVTRKPDQCTCWGWMLSSLLWKHDLKESTSGI